MKRQHSKLAAVGLLLLLGFFPLQFAEPFEEDAPPASRGSSPQVNLRASKQAMIEDNLKVGRPAWYPFKREPPKGFIFPTGKVTMSQADASRQFGQQFNRYIAHALKSKDELPYFTEAAQFFYKMSHAHDPVALSATPRYSASKTTTMSIQRSIRGPDIAVISLYMPYWKEVDDWFVEEAARDDFFIALTHEFEHFAEGFWRDERDHSEDENVRSEAYAWSRTCERAVAPLQRRGRWVDPHTTATCALYENVGRKYTDPTFLALIRRKSAIHH